MAFLGRISNFRISDLSLERVNLFDMIITEYPDSTIYVKKLGEDLGKMYLELTDVNQDGLQEDIYKKVSTQMKLSIKLDRLMDYCGIDSDLKRSSPEECIESVNLLSKAIGDSHKKIIYYSSLQGDLLQAVKDSTTVTHIYFFSFTYSDIKILRIFSY